MFSIKYIFLAIIGLYIFQLIAFIFDLHTGTIWNVFSFTTYYFLPIGILTCIFYCSFLNLTLKKKYAHYSKSIPFLISGFFHGFSLYYLSITASFIVTSVQLSSELLQLISIVTITFFLSLIAPVLIYFLSQAYINKWP